MSAPTSSSNPKERLKPKRTAPKKSKPPAKRQRKGDSEQAGEAAPAGDAEALKSMKPGELAKHTEYFLIKDEPSDYSIEMLEAEKGQTAEWDGVRNHTAKNVILEMRKGNQVLFYRSGTKGPGVVGIVEVVKDPYPDPTSWDESNKKAFDPKSTPEEPRWFMVDFKMKQKFDGTVTLETLKQHKEGELEGLAMFKQSRLSVMPVFKTHFDFIVGLAQQTDKA